jgi:hypothetical protein
MSDPISSTSVSTARLAAVLASIAAGITYLFIGLGFVSVGQSTQTATTDLFAFGLLMAGFSWVVAVLLWAFASSRPVLVGVAIVQLIALVGYVAAWSLRDPPFELWGIVIKVCQAIVLVGVIALLARRRAASRLPKGGAA